MTSDILSKYSELPYILIGLDLKNELLDRENPILLESIFMNIKDCEEFIIKQINNEKIVVIISGQLSSNELNQLKKYSNIDAIYQFTKSDNFDEQLKCIYTKPIERNYREIFIKYLKKFWFIIGLILVILFAVIFPHLGASNGPLYAEYTINWGCVILISFFSGLLISTKMLKYELFHFRLHIFIQVYALLFMPFVIYGICLLLIKTSFNKILINGVIAMGCTSTTIASNVILTKNAGGNVPAALVNGVLCNVIGVLVSPALIWLFMLNNEINVLHQQYGMGSYLHILLNLTLTVLIPLITGQILHSIWTEKVIWLDSKFHFSVINSICLLILVWSTFCDLFQSKSLKTIHEFDLIILILLNAFLYIIFSLLAMFIARLPNIFICHKQIIDNDQQPLLLEDNQKSKRTLIERWRFSREDTIAIMFCCTTKTVAKGVTLINAVNYKNNEDLMGLISLPLVLYYIEQQMIASVEVILLQNWLKSKTDTN